MVAIPFPLSSAPGVKPQEGAGRLINCYAEKLGEGARFPVRWTRSPGLRESVSTITGHSHLRGGIVVSSTWLVVMDERCYGLTLSGSTYTATSLGALAGTTPVTCAKNNAATPNIVCVTENGARNLFTGSAPTDFADTDLPQPNSVAEINGYLVFTLGDGRIFATGLNNVSVATNSFTTEQGLILRRGVSFRGEFFAMGDRWTGVYRDAGTSPFPLERRFTIPRGICGTHAVAGWEPGWANELIWVGDDGRVYRLNGYTPEAISSLDVERAIAAATDRTLLEASVYMSGGNPFWVLTSPGEWTWEYNARTQNWNERKSYGRDDWRGSQTIKAFDHWMVGDRTTGKLFRVDEAYYKEATDPLVWHVESGIVANFPARLGAPRADFDFTAAVGSASGEDPIQTDPSVQISWSDDGGYRYGNPVLRKLGAEGAANQSVTVQRTGLVKAKGRRFRLVVSDPVHVALMGGQMAVEQRAA